MAKKVLTNEVLKVLAGRKKTIPEIASEIGKPVEEVQTAMLGLTSEGLVLEQADFYWVTGEDGIARPDLSDLEWKVVRLLLKQKAKPEHIYDMAASIAKEEVKSAVDRLIALGIVVQDKDGGYKITSKTELMIPLDAEEREELRAAEIRIDQFVDEIHGRQLEVARELRRIRDRKLYRETHKRFQDYVEARFERTRDWAYKMIRDLEVGEALLSGKKSDENVEALLQTVSAREMPHLSRLKKDPDMMRKALQNAEEKAKSEGRDRTTDDVKEAVKVVADGKNPEDEKPKEPEVKKTRTVKFVGVEHEEVTTDDVPTFLVKFAGWLRKNPTDKAFSIKVGKAV